MSCSNRSQPRLVLGLSALLALAAGQASAQVASNCPNYSDTSNGAYCINGSDTLFDIVTQSIKNKVASDKAAVTAGTAVAPTILQGTSGAALSRSALFYNGGGSGNAENSMKAGAPGAGGTIGGGGLGTQSIGAMSRNFRPATVTQFPSWQPTVQNVVGLDAAVIVVKNTANRYKNFALPLLATDGTKANPNTSTLSITFGTPGSGYDQILEVILSGIDGSGSVAACSDPRRLQAVADFSAANGVGLIAHFYRRDDNSGTTDTFKDKIAVGRFCNGAGAGVLGTNITNANLNNQDFDPIRRPCDGPIAGVRNAVSCTDLTTGSACTDSVANPNCTQGLVTALSDNDPGRSDITTSIAGRVGNDSSGQTVGYAGREAARQAGNPTAAPFINTLPPSDTLVRQDLYMLARRLFVQRAPSNSSLDAAVSAGTTARSNATGVCASPPCLEKASDLNTTSNTLKCPQLTSNTCAGGGTTQQSFEDALFNYMTDSGGTGSQDGAPGRCNVDPVVKQFGFLTCLDDCTLIPSGSGNLCSKSPYPNPAAPPSACFPATQFGATGNWTYCAVTCCSNLSSAAGGAACPAATGRAANFACSTAGVQSECGAGLTCTDLGAGLLACQ
jgi:ABC-type phosphate transport system substrate-binding protein